MDAANAGRIDHTRPGPIDDSVLKLQSTHRSEAIWNGQDPGALTCRGRTEEFSNREPMVDDRVVHIIKALGLEGLLRQPGRELDHGLITALVERWRPETHTFHMPHGEMTITLQDVEVILGLPIDGDAVTGSTQKTWTAVCEEFLGFQPITQDQHKELHGQRILIKRLLEQVANPLPPNAEEDELYRYARCYILALLGDTIFMDKSGDRVHLMWVQQLEDLRNPRRYSWGSACLAWLYRELCRASHKETSQIGGCLLLVQYWVWARFPYLCPAIERGPPVGAYGPPARGPLYLKWAWVPNKKNRPAHIFRDRYRQQIASMLPSQVVWQPYEAHFEDLPPWCVAGRAVWTATVPLVCFHLVEIHTPDRVVRQFGMIQEIPEDVNTDPVLHAIDLRGKVGVDWMRKHATHLLNWGNRLQRCCQAVLGDMPPQHQYFDWFKRVTRRFIDVPGATLTILVTSPHFVHFTVLLSMKQYCMHEATLQI
ncbi:serine/threonine-protein phosphatase 7 long form homolog [Quercus robur]|uniref:serine/threonine-protein phosphatase 7 long form homolog n=1 Tax=Quercus robur TaxID=38942 RepID=UPI00216143ED|nr:serine/threonine-protein phosphatase 7 long form homolog [Quercus robur]